MLVTLISVLLFLGYARAGAWLPEQAMASPDGLAHARRAGPGPGRAAGSTRALGRGPARTAARPAARSRDAGRMVAARPRGQRPVRPPRRRRAPRTRDTPRTRTRPAPAPHAAAATPYNPATAPTVVQRKPPVRPWWEQER